MAAKKSGSSATTKKVAENPEATQATKEVVETKKESKKREFKNTDGVKCTSVTSGGLYMVGIKSDTPYTWVDAGDVVEVEYQDLVAEVRRRGMYVFRPRFIVDDADFIAQFPELDTLYAGMYSKRDLRQIFQADPNQLREIVTNLPIGARDTLKSMAVDAIDRGELDSINRIKVLDEIFGTQLLLRLSM